MFLSQRIAKDPKFLKLVSLTDSRSVSDIRVKIMNSEKFIVGSEQLDLTVSGGNKNTEAWDLAMNQEGLDDRLGVYKQFAKLPYRCIFIENNNHGMLVELSNRNTVVITSVSMAGVFTGELLGYAAVSSIGLELSLINDCVVPYPDRRNLVQHYYSERAKEGYLESSDRVKWQLDSGQLFIVLQIAEILLFLNARNRKLVSYQLNKTEGSKIPKPLLPKYTYHVLDIYRDHEIYQSQGDIEDTLFCNKEESAKRRMHFVRGHFKQKKTGLFWWNPFVRNARNATLGFVNKDYRLHMAESLT